MRLVLISLLGTALFSVPAAAETVQTRLHLHTPTVCNLKMGQFPQSEGGMVRFGAVTEYCNSSAGYELVAEFNDTVPSGQFLIDGQAVPVTGARTVLAVSSDAGIRQRQVLYSGADNAITEIAFQLRLVPRGL